MAEINLERVEEVTNLHNELQNKIQEKGLEGFVVLLDPINDQASVTAHIPNPTKMTLKLVEALINITASEALGGAIPNHVDFRKVINTAVYLYASEGKKEGSKLNQILTAMKKDKEAQAAAGE